MASSTTRLSLAFRNLESVPGNFFVFCFNFLGGG